MGIYQTSRFDDVIDPAKKLWLLILNRASRDAEKGNLEALAWLWIIGCEVADFITDGAYYEVRRFVVGELKKLDLDSDTKLTYGFPLGE